MDEMKFFSNLIDRLIENSDREGPKSLTRDVCDGIRYALSTLETSERECLQLHLGEGLCYAEMARMWGMSADSVRHIEEKVIRKLRDTSRWDYIQYGIVGNLKTAQEISNTKGYNKGYKDGYQDGWEDGRIGKKPAGTSQEILNMPIACLELSTRAYNCLVIAGCERIGDVTKLSDEAIYRMRNLGKKSAKEIACALQNQGVQGSNWEKYIVG